MSYTRPPSSEVDFNQGALGYEPIPQTAVDFTFVEVISAPGEIFPGGAENTVFGSTGIRNASESFKPAPFVSSVFGVPSLRNTRKIVSSAGAIGSRIVFGRPLVFNLRQYLFAGGASVSSYGVAYVQGGVKLVRPSGLASYLPGRPLVINTTADQEAFPQGISAPLLGQPRVSPQTVFTSGFIGWVGTPLVQRNPSPAGFDVSAFGYPVVIYKTRYLRPGGIGAFETGYPRAADKARKVYHTASAVTSVFGDIAVHAKRFLVSAKGVESLEMSPWAEVRNTRRFVLAAGAAPPGVGGGTQARNKTPSIAPAGIASLSFGRQDHMVVGWRVRELRPSGVPVPFAPVGLPSLWQTPGLKPAGIAAPAVPVPAVWPAVRTVQQHGSAMLRFGMASLDFAYRMLQLEGKGIDSQAHGVARVEHGIRRVLAQGAPFASYGTAWVSFGLRAIAPKGIARVEMDVPQVGGLRFIAADGFVATRWGTRIIPKAQVLFPLGFAENFGLATARNRRAYLHPNGITTYKQPFEHWGTAKAWNLRQYVAMFEDPGSGLNPPHWPLWTAVANRNRAVGAIGALASIVPAPAVENKARPIYPAGILAPTLAKFQKSGMVSHRVRPLRLDGLEPPYMPGWANVSNAAVLLKLAGLHATLWGRPTVENTRRFYKLQGFDSAWFGYPFVADRIRTLTFESRYGIAPPRIALPDVHLHTRYVEAKGIDHPEVGRASLDIHWNKIWPKWTHRNFFGSPALRNRTPELFTRGRATDEYGDTLVRLQWRPVAPHGPEATLFGRTVVADRKQHIQVAGANYSRIGDRLVVVRTGAPPLATQYITLIHPQHTPEGPLDGYGIEPPGGIPNPPPHSAQFGRPVLQQQVLYVHEEREQTRIGSPVVTANSIRVEPGIYELTVGEPFVSLRVRTLAPQGFLEKIEPGKPRLSPHTIYAVMDAPKQALENHAPRDIHYVRSAHVFGSVQVENRHRSLNVHWPFDGMVFGATTAHNKRQYLRPTGTRMQRFGWPVVPGDQTVEFFTTIDTMAFGAAKVAPPPYVGPQYLRPNGFAPGPSTNSRVEHFHRKVFAQGSNTLQMGRSDYPDKPPQAPYAWRYLHVGAPMPTIPQGIASEAFGNTWVSLRVRGIGLEGFDSFACEYDYQQFAKRMRVRNAADGRPPRRFLQQQGRDCAHVGAPGLRHGTQYIRPDGNSDQHRKGAF